MSAQFFWYQTDLSWHNDGVPGGYSFPVSKGKWVYLWAPLPHSPGTEEQFDNFLNLQKENEISQPTIYPIYFHTLWDITRSCCCQFTLFPLAQREWSFQGKGAMSPPLVGRTGKKVIQFSLEKGQQKGYSHLCPQGSKTDFETATGSV